MPQESFDATNPELLKSKLALETALISWKELEVHYARGSVIEVQAELDLVAVGLELIQDNKTLFESWIQQKLVGAVAPEQAHLWHTHNTQVWALVVAPWVLVQLKPSAEEVH